MATAIVYHSQTGSCKRYAELLSARLHLPCYADGRAPVRPDTEVIYVGWTMAGKVAGLAKARKRYRLAGVVQVGMSPVGPDSVEQGRSANRLPASIPFFVLQGGFHMRLLPGGMQLVMKPICAKLLKDLSRAKAQRSLNPAEQALYTMVSTGEGAPPSWDVSEITEHYLVPGGGLSQSK